MSNMLRLDYNCHFYLVNKVTISDHFHVRIMGGFSHLPESSYMIRITGHSVGRVLPSVDSVSLGYIICELL